jgi:hypothetical protein
MIYESPKINEQMEISGVGQDNLWVIFHLINYGQQKEEFDNFWCPFSHIQNMFKVIFLELNSLYFTFILNIRMLYLFSV